MDYDPEPVRSNTEKHSWISRLYTEAMRTVSTEFTIFLEDDTIPPTNSFKGLYQLINQEGAGTACAGAAYRSRPHPWRICARVKEGWDELDSLAEFTPVNWVGGGFTIYRTKELQNSLPFYCKVWGRNIRGWDIVLSDELKARQKKQLLATKIRAAHMCSEVIQYCRDKGYSVC